MQGLDNSVTLLTQTKGFRWSIILGFSMSFISLRWLQNFRKLY